MVHGYPVRDEVVESVVFVAAMGSLALSAAEGAIERGTTITEEVARLKQHDADVRAAVVRGVPRP